LRDRAPAFFASQTVEYENSDIGRSKLFTDEIARLSSAPLTSRPGSITEMFRRAAIGHSGVWATRQFTINSGHPAGTVGATALWMGLIFFYSEAAA
jgi:hypothetical protein